MGITAAEVLLDAETYGGLRGGRYLTKPSIGVYNDGYDNIFNDLIMYHNCPLVNLEAKRRYIVKDVLGKGSFGQVAKCWVEGTDDLFVAVKVIKNDPAYCHQALIEVSILTELKEEHDPFDEYHIVRILDQFVHKKHVCITFELLGKSLHSILAADQFRGLPLSTVRSYSRQILEGLCLLKEARIIHADLKPENILQCSSAQPGAIKIIDFGIACMEDEIFSSYIQTRNYRAPEVICGNVYDTAIDMWSFGCIVSELFLGVPLFLGASQDEILVDVTRVLKGQHPKLKQIIENHPYKENISTEEYAKEKQTRTLLIDFLRGLLEVDPGKRSSPSEALKHPFVASEQYGCCTNLISCANNFGSYEADNLGTMEAIAMGRQDACNIP